MSRALTSCLSACVRRLGASRTPSASPMVCFEPGDSDSSMCSTTTTSLASPLSSWADLRIVGKRTQNRKVGSQDAHLFHRRRYHFIDFSSLVNPRKPSRGAEHKSLDKFNLQQRSVYACTNVVTARPHEQLSINDIVNGRCVWGVLAIRGKE